MSDEIINFLFPGLQDVVRSNVGRQMSVASIEEAGGGCNGRGPAYYVPETTLYLGVLNSNLGMEVKKDSREFVFPMENHAVKRDTGKDNIWKLVNGPLIFPLSRMRHLVYNPAGNHNYSPGENGLMFYFDDNVVKDFTRPNLRMIGPDESYPEALKLLGLPVTEDFVEYLKEYLNSRRDMRLSV